MPEVKPFDRLDRSQQVACIDVAIGIAILAARCSGFGRKEFNAIADTWAESSGLDHNLCRYALRNVSEELYDTAWDFSVAKNESDTIVTHFQRRKKEVRGNGEAPVQ